MRGIYRRMADFVVSTSDPDATIMPIKGQGRHLGYHTHYVVDGGKAIVAGNERVIRARLSDAKFFYDTDLKIRLEDRLPKFEHIVFHEKLGTQAARIARITALAGQLAPIVGADVAKAERAAQLCKADLLTDVVGEFPELQGLMGRYYAEAQDEDEDVAHACEDHYKPKGPDDLVPADPVSIAVGLADKLDTLVGFWAIDEKPTGNKDPYGLRRAELGVIRLVVENNLRLNFSEVTELAFDLLVTNHIASTESVIIKFLRQKPPTEREAIVRIADQLKREIPTAEILIEAKVGRLRADMEVLNGMGTTEDRALKPPRMEEWRSDSAFNSCQRQSRDHRRSEWARRCHPP